MESSYLAELTAVFLDEAEEQLLIMEQEILKLEQIGGSEDTIQTLFRAAHTLKGSSAAMGLEEIKQLTHEMEHILDQVRNLRLRVTNEMINLLFQCLDLLRSLKDEFMEGKSSFTDITLLLNKVKQFTAEQENYLVNDCEAIPASSWQILDPELQLKVQEMMARGLHVHDVLIGLEQDSIMKSARALIIINQIQSVGEVLTSQYSLQDLEGEDTDAISEIRLLLATPKENTEFESEILSMMDVSYVKLSRFTPDHEEEGMPAMATAIPIASEWGGTKEAFVATEGRKNKQTIRVDVERLEHLMNLVGELVIDQMRISQVGNILDHRYSSDETVDELGQISDHVSRVVGELQESVMKARMLQIDQLFQRFPRMIRDLALRLNKEVTLIIEGNETELDRTVIEEIADPLIHLIRNAIDHGLESTEVRKSSGKSAQGRIRLAAAHEENQLVISVEDDGDGIDPNKIRNQAVRKGIISQEEANKLTDFESVYLIFRPGFSTASEVSDVSGRGVGMDIVRNQIEKLNGVIDIETRLGEGTRFKIKLPLTLAIITGLLIKLNGTTFILPMNSVIEIVRIPLDFIHSITGEPVVLIREKVMPVVWMHDYFQIPRMEQTGKHQSLIVVGSADKRIALVVDDLLGNQQIVVKSLGIYVGKIDCISGATILGDGRVALILETAGIIRRVS
ncbi:two-component system, chemotaxis family, sensor kinase CheA [Paenibacillus sp. 1_12]|uniref:chemotaxis protein CheA n=1 Tax=Paenibacillus sp. 1_12 TaxID=1566278 RepID=UPI0008EBB934|nr:chemotaxis protein CheA [Paenibacillus sp. 1_12]SFL12246.1 two-component system, chemotaxis family, sensor kinase CheA [Paenibacillus sp. 1_12]